MVEISENAQIQRDGDKWALKPILSVKNEWWNVEITLRSDHKIEGSQFLGILGCGEMSNVTKIIGNGRFFIENDRFFKKISKISKMPEPLDKAKIYAGA